MIVSAAGLLLAVAPAFAQSGGGYDLSWNTIDGGGISSAAGGEFSLGGTVGQPDATPSGALNGSSYALTGGFWSGLWAPLCTVFPVADFNHDCFVDADDLAEFSHCAAGPKLPVPVGCEGQDLDGDGDVDQEDFGVFQRCYNGPGEPADPNCGH